MSYGMEAYSSTGVCQFSTRAYTCFRHSAITTITNWTFNPFSGNYFADVPIPNGLTLSDVLVLVRPTSLNSTQVASYFLTGSAGSGTSVKIFTFHPINTQVSFGVTPNHAELEATGVGLHVFDSLGNLTFSSNAKRLLKVFAESTEAVSVPTFSNNYYDVSSLIYQNSSTTYNNISNKPWGMLSGSQIKGAVGGSRCTGLSVNRYNTSGGLYAMGIRFYATATSYNVYTAQILYEPGDVELPWDTRYFSTTDFSTLLFLEGV